MSYKYFAVNPASLKALVFLGPIYTILLVQPTLIIVACDLWIGVCVGLSVCLFSCSCAATFLFMTLEKIGG